MIINDINNYERNVIFLFQIIDLRNQQIEKDLQVKESM